jgi:tetratricopeptide (TPR) repeat protein
MSKRMILACAAPLIALLLLAVGGCARPSATPAAQRPDSPDDAFFAEGAGRPPTLKTRYAMARLLGAQGKDNECAFILEQLIRERPQCLPAYSDLAELYMRHRRFDEAIRTLEAGLRVAQQQDPILVNNLGMCRMIEGDYDAALSAFSKADALAPDDARFKANHAAALGMLGRYDEALALYEQVLAPADAHFNLAVICEARQDLERAQAEYRLANDLAEASAQEYEL